MNLDTEKLSARAGKANRADLKRLLDAINADREWDLVADVAYFLGTIQHECAGTWRPIEEIGKGRGKPYGMPTTNGQTYYGRGFVQLTWKTNYQKAGRLLSLDLVASPDKALEFDTAYRIASRGMREGWFTGKSLSDYINASSADYIGARAIINGSDRATQIAGYARDWEKAIREADAPAVIAEVQQDAPNSFHLADISSHFEEAKDAAEKVQDVAGSVTAFVGKRSDTIKAFRIFMSQSVTGIGAAISGFYTSNKTMIYAGLAIFAVIGILYFLRQWHLGAIREKKQ